MPAMHTPYPALVAALVALAPITAAHAETGDAPSAPSVIDTLPYAKHLASAGLDREKTEALAHNVDQLLTRLQLDDQHVALDRPTDLHALLMLATEVQILLDRGEDGAPLRRAALSTAYMLHLMGHAYETRQAVRTAIDSLPDQAPPDRKSTWEALVTSVQRMRKVGRDWFAQALPGVLRDDPQNAAVHDQRGMWLLREGRFEEAAAAFAQAFRKSEIPRHALNLYEALLAAGKDDEAKRLAKRLTDAAPALAGQLEDIREEREDERATRSWEALPESRYDDVAGCIAQLHRYWWRGRDGAAILLAKRLEKEHFDVPAARHAVAEAWLATERMDELQALLIRAERDGGLDSRLLEARIAWAVRMAIPTSISAASGPPADARLDADLKRLAAEGGERGKLVGHAARLLIPIGERRAELSSGREEASPKLLARFEKAAAAGLSDLPSSLEMRLLALAGYVAFGEPLDGVALAAKGLDALSEDDRRSLSLLLAQVELGYAARSRDRAKLDAARAKLDAIAEGLPKKRPAGWDEPAWKYTRAIAELASDVLDGATLSEAAAKKALATLPRPLVDFDVEAAGGAIYAQGLAATRGTLMLALDRKDEAVAAFGRLRLLAPSEPVSKLATAQVQLMVGDASGAWELLNDGLGGDLRPIEAFLARKWRAITASFAGEAEAAAREAKEQLALWDVAKAPDEVAPRSPRPLFVGDFNVGLRFMPGEPLRVDVHATPIVLLLPDAPQTRAEVEALAKKASTP